MNLTLNTTYSSYIHTKICLCSLLHTNCSLHCKTFVCDSLSLRCWLFESSVSTLHQVARTCDSMESRKLNSTRAETSFIRMSIQCPQLHHLMYVHVQNSHNRNCTQTDVNFDRLQCTAEDNEYTIRIWTIKQHSLQTREVNTTRLDSGQYIIIANTHSLLPSFSVEGFEFPGLLLFVFLVIP